MKRSFPHRLAVLAAALGLGAATAAAQPAPDPVTRAEATDYRETTRYDEVFSFLRVLGERSERLHVTSFGYTVEGRALPLVVFGDAAAATPEAVRATGKTRVFVMANIHAGEVCGKEAVLMLLRDLVAGEHAAWTDSLVLLFAPIYNADGNERVSLYNRPEQYGPVGGMGQRPNAQGLDLNRDHMKLDAPEARSLAALLSAYDPHVVVDLHTTNGTYHAYHLTYAYPLHPNTYEPLAALLRDDWLPAVTARIREAHGWHFYHYGNLPWPGQVAERGWYTFDYRPRFNTHYAGIRNRLGILSEAYAYLPFEERVAVTRVFVESLLDYAHAHAGRLRALCDEADRATVAGLPQALRADYARSEAPVEILMGEVDTLRNPYSGALMLRRRDVATPERMPGFETFRPTETETAPAAYYVPAWLAPAVDRVAAHGLAYERLDAPQTLRLERFRIDSSAVAARAFQGHHERTLYGAYEVADVALPAGTLVVPVDQPLGRLAFLLLEPRSDDGLTAWGLLDDALQGAAHYPIYRRAATPAAPR